MQSLVNIDKLFVNEAQSLQSVGVPNTGVSAEHYSADGHHILTKLTVSKSAALTLADNASLADGYLLYTFPAGALIVSGSNISMTVTNAEHDTEACVFGLGTTIASGAVSVLSGTAAFQNVMAGQSAVIGTAELDTVTTALAVEAAGDHTLYFNVAGAWANTAGTALDADIAGTVFVNWIKAN